jgi:hypothetical protein
MSNSIGASHVGFLVDDIMAKKAELEAKGIEFSSDVNRVDEGVLAGWRWVYFEDPDGYPLELVEVAYDNAGEREAGIAKYLASRDECAAIAVAVSSASRRDAEQCNAAVLSSAGVRQRSCLAV